MAKSWAPTPYPFRNPKSTTQKNGRILNPPRAMKFAGKGEATLLDIDKFQRGTKGPNGVRPVSSRGR